MSLREGGERQTGEYKDCGEHSAKAGAIGYELCCGWVVL